MSKKYFIYGFSFILFFSISFSAYDEIDRLQEQSMFEDALKLCELNLDTNDTEILWRISRSYFDIADQTSDEKIQKIYIDKALPFAKSAVELNPLSARANHWYAVIIGKKGVLEGTKQKIINSYEVREYGLNAIKLDPKYDGTYHLMGRWHFNVADLAWYERTIASAIYATPPDGSFEEAATYFKEAIKVNPDDIRHYLWLAKSYYQMNNYKDSKLILEKALSLDIKNDSDRIILNQIKELYKKL